MNRTMLFLLLPVSAVACRDEVPSSPADAPRFAVTAGRPAYLVTGGGSVVRADIAGSPREVYGFSAQVDAQGNALGEAEVHFPSNGANMYIAVQCLAVERNWAWMSGPVTRSDDPDTPLGRVFLWRVQDNGEGQGAPPDRVSNFLADNYPADICTRKRQLTTFPWDNGNVRILTPSMPNLADLVGTWDATVLYFINPDDAADTVSLFEGGGRMRWTVAPNGRWTQIWWTPEAIFENTAGVMDLINGTMIMLADGDPPVPITCAGGRVTGEHITSDCLVEHGYDWDGDGSDDPSRVVAELRRKRTGVLITDLAGTWDATVWRYTSIANPTVTLDVLAEEGRAVILTMSLDSRLYFVIKPENWTSETTAFLIDGNRMLARDGSEAQSFVFSLERDHVSFSGLQAVDFDHDGTQDPALLEAVLVRR